MSIKRQPAGKAVQRRVEHDAVVMSRAVADDLAQAQGQTEQC